jgi:hypothetical protein
VAEFHRLPEHPGDCSDESSCGTGRSSDGMETTSMTSTFIAASADEVKERFQWKKGVPEMIARSWD